MICFAQRSFQCRSVKLSILEIYPSVSQHGKSSCILPNLPSPALSKAVYERLESAGDCKLRHPSSSLSFAPARHA